MASVDIENKSSTRICLTSEREDAEMALLEERLELLQSQRTLAALHCQKFADFVEETLVKHSTSPKATASFSRRSSLNREKDSDNNSTPNERTDVWGNAIVSSSSRHVSRKNQGRRGSLDSLSQQQTHCTTTGTSAPQSSRPRRRSSFERGQSQVPFPSSSSGSETVSSTSTPRRQHRRATPGAQRPIEMNSDMGREAAQYYSNARPVRRLSESAPRQQSPVEASTSNQAPQPVLFDYRGFGNKAATPATHIPTLSTTSRPLALGYQQDMNPIDSLRKVGVGSGSEDGDTSEASDADVFLKGPRSRVPVQRIKRVQPGRMVPPEASEQEPTKRTSGFRKFFRR